MKLGRWWPLVALLGLLTACGAPSAGGKVVTVRGVGRASAVPDEARVTLGVSATASTAQAAQSADAARAGAVVTALGQAGVAAADLGTAWYGLQREYLPHGAVVFRASDQVTVTVRHLKRLGQLLDVAVAHGADSVQGVRFTLADPTTVRDAALAAALRDAASRARAAVRAEGVALGAPLKIRQSSTAGKTVPPTFARAATSAAVPVLPPGKLTYTARVVVTYAMD